MGTSYCPKYLIGLQASAGYTDLDVLSMREGEELFPLTHKEKIAGYAGERRGKGDRISEIKKLLQLTLP